MKLVRWFVKWCVLDLAFRAVALVVDRYIAAGQPITHSLTTPETK